MENKFAILIIFGFLIFTLIGITLDEINSNKKHIEFAKLGLEQCPNKNFGPSTIWVKSCTEFLNSQK